MIIRLRLFQGPIAGQTLTHRRSDEQDEHSRRRWFPGSMPVESHTVVLLQLPAIHRDRQQPAFRNQSVEERNMLAPVKLCRHRHLKRDELLRMVHSGVIFKEVGAVVLFGEQASRMLLYRYYSLSHGTRGWGQHMTEHVTVRDFRRLGFSFPCSIFRITVRTRRPFPRTPPALSRHAFAGLDEV